MPEEVPNTRSRDAGKTARLVPTAVSQLQRWFPFGVWIREYRWQRNGLTDLVAAITVAGILIPESLGAASIAGVPSQVALYATPLALIGYAFFGGSRLMVFAVTGALSAITANVVGQLAAGDPEKAILFASGFALAGSLILLAAGLLKLGWIVNFISRSVMLGIIVGMSIQIIVGQLPKLVGVKTPDGSSFSKAWNTFSQIASWKTEELVAGTSALVLILMMERYVPRFPAALIVVVLGSALVAIAGLHLELVPRIPSGLPMVSFPVGITTNEWTTLLVAGLVLSLVCFSESWGASASVSRKTHDELDVDQEFRAYGIANLGASVLGGMPVSGSLSKSATAVEAGATSQMSNIFLAGIVILVLLFLSPAFQWLPETALAAIVIAAIRHPANPTQFLKIWHLEKLYTCTGIATAILVLTVDLMPAMAFGVTASLLYLIFRITFPGGALLGKVQNKEIFRPIRIDFGRRTFKSEFDAEPIDGIILYRFSAPLIFANARTFVSRIKNYLIETGERTRAVVIDCEVMSYVDLTGLEALIEIEKYCERFGIKLYLARMHETSFKVISSSEELEDLCAYRTFHTIREAVVNAQRGE